MRLFLGIQITKDVADKISTIQERFSDFEIKMVEKENLHYNLKFLGNVADQNIDKIKKKIVEISEKLHSFEINISGLGVFPSEKQIRVIWLGVKEGKDQLISINRTIEESFEELGFENDTRFTPHLTLGRVRDGQNRELASLVGKMKEIKVGKIKVDKIILFQSQLSPKGPTYIKVFSVKLTDDSG